ncbi:MAG: hypothetical protein ABFD92_14220 [Planctomycetaceae bacterium]|nr:hypothetical protein [Planctomycetaceae bacterium]
MIKASVVVLAIVAAVVAAPASDSVELTGEAVLDVNGTGPDGKGNTADDTWQFWFETVVPRGKFLHLDLCTQKMTADQREKGIYDAKAKRGKGKVQGPIADKLPNPKETEGWIFHSDWDGRFEGVWADKKTKKVILYPYVEKGQHRCVAISYTVPKAGTYALSGGMSDLHVWKHEKHDGIFWQIATSADAGKSVKVVAKGGPFGDEVAPASTKIDVKDIKLAAGELLFIIVDPGKWWGSDMASLDDIKITRTGD